MQIDVVSALPFQCPDRLKKSLQNCTNCSEVLDVVLKVLGDSSDADGHDAAVGLLVDLAFEMPLQCSEAEFAVLSLRNVFLSSSVDHILTQIAIAMTSIILARKEVEERAELARAVAATLTEAAKDPAQSEAVRLASLDCLLELETCIPGCMANLVEWCLDQCGDSTVGSLAARLLAAILTNRTSELPEAAVVGLIDSLPELEPFTAALVGQALLDIVLEGYEPQLEAALGQLLHQRGSTFDLCLVRTIVQLQVRLGGVTADNPLWNCCTQPGLPVACHLMALEQAGRGLRLGTDVDAVALARRLEPTPYDGADSRLKKMLVLDRLIVHTTDDSVEEIETAWRRALRRLMAHAVGAATSRCAAAVFRAVRHHLDALGAQRAAQVALEACVAMATTQPRSLAHAADLLRWSRGRSHRQLSRRLVLQLVDALDDAPPADLAAHLTDLAALFIEASTLEYQHCQPRVMLSIARKCVEGAVPVAVAQAGAVLELCQALIRNQDYDIFAPELSRLLSLLEKSCLDKDMQHRAWMLRSLVAHINTDNLKDAFDVDVDLSRIGTVEHWPEPAILLELVPLDPSTDSQSVDWSDQGVEWGSRYAALRLRRADAFGHPDAFGVRVDFDVEPADWGRVDDVYLPTLGAAGVRNACLHLQPRLCAAVTVLPRVVLSTLDGRILWCRPPALRLELDAVLSPLAAAAPSPSWLERLGVASVVAVADGRRLDAALDGGRLAKFRLPAAGPLLALVTPQHRLLVLQPDADRCHIFVQDVPLLGVAQALLAPYTHPPPSSA